MTRLVACLAPWMATTVALAQAQTGLTVDYTFHGSFFDQGARVEGACYVTPALMRRIGWSVDVDNGVVTVAAEGRTFQLESKIIEGQRLYSFDQAMRYLGGVVDYDSAQAKVTVLSQIRSIEKTASGMRADGTLSFEPRAFRASAPDRLVVDLKGAQLAPSLISDLPKGWSVSQFTPDTVRVVVQEPSMAGVTVPTLQEGRTLEVPFVQAGSGAAPVVPVQALATVGSPRKSTETPTSVAVVLPITGKPAQKASALFLDPTTVQVSLPSTGAEKTGEFPLGQSKYLKGASVNDDKAGNTTLTLQLTQPLAFQLSTNEVGVSIVFSRPRATGGLAGKVIVVDAGHGGKDNGAVHAGVQEKNMTLAMAKEVARQLIQAGASVVMTRSDDTFVSLSERPGIANRGNADLFISCHFNSNSVDGSRSGIIVFFHKEDSMDMLLAECIRHEIAKEHQLPDIGTWSDGRIYDSGFAVLRGAKMPAVLMELGFLNHPTDRSKIQTQEFREAVGRAVVRGVKEFFGDGKRD
ncbi:MAG: N-acetylmuramoyl-L-alanine amidase [Armatimonadetes bacterium]|nr:N-acetylmuramoyl-L-alanine amidase [Armatimonadota bacterium]